jgi:nucleotide-binding universal stress UspA family protein
MEDVMFKHVLIPLDGSEYALRALQSGEGIAKLSGARLTLLSVLLRSEAAGALHVGKLDERSEEHLQGELDALVERVKHRTGLDEVDATVLFGQPAHQITEYANENDVDLIAMSTHGLGATGHYALGSVALKVLMTAKCPVFMVRILGHGAPD